MNRRRFENAVAARFAKALGIGQYRIVIDARKIAGRSALWAWADFHPFDPPHKVKASKLAAGLDVLAQAAAPGADVRFFYRRSGAKIWYISKEPADGCFESIESISVHDLNKLGERGSAKMIA